MDTKQWRLWAACALAGGVVLVSAPVMAVIGGTNFRIGGYPEPLCSQPYSKPSRPYEFSDQYEVDRYNREVAQYNEDFRQFRECVRDYVESAANDIKRIEERIDDAVQSVNAASRG